MRPAYAPADEYLGLRGCFAFVMKVDPRNLFYESNEGDNESRCLVHLPFRRDTG